MNTSPMSLTPPLTPLKELARRSEHDATLLVSDGRDRIFVHKLIPTQIANLEVWQALARTEHPSLIKVWQVSQEPWGLSVLMDYVSGPTLEQLVEAQGALDPAQTVSLVNQVAQGAAQLHSLGIIHRDLSPSNIIAGPAGACIIDAGIARLQSPTAKRHDTVLLGTHGFAAPEQYGFAETSPRTDVYALGKLTGYLLTGISPASPIYEEALDDPAVVPATLRRVIERACSLSPADRPATGEAFAHELQQALDSLSLAEKPAPSQLAIPTESVATTSQDVPTPQPAPSASAPQAVPTQAAAPYSSRADLPAWRQRLATIATVMGAVFCAIMATGLFNTPADITIPAAVWKFQAVSIGLLIGLAPGLITRWYLLKQRRFATAKHPFLTWIGLLVALFFIAVALVGISQAMFATTR